MSANTNNLSSTPQTVYIEHAIHPERDDYFRALAASTKFLKASQKNSSVQCTQCQTKLDKPLKCAKCKSVWYCSKECQKKNWSTHKPACHEVERSSGVLKFIQMFSVNPLLMGFLKVGIVFDCGLFENPRIGFDVPFMARVDIAMEPSDVLDFAGLYFNDEVVGEKLQGMLQVNAITPWNPGTQGPLTPKRLQIWREARAKYNAQGFAKDPVGLVEFISCSCAEDSGNSVTAELHIPAGVLNIARKREPFTGVSAVTGAQFNKPMSTVTCLEYVNLHIRADKQNQLRLRAEMTEQDKEAIRAAGRNEDTLPARILKEKMKREHLYAGVMEMTREIVQYAKEHEGQKYKRPLMPRIWRRWEITAKHQEVMSSVFETPICIPDLTDQIIKDSDTPAAVGGYATIFKCSWNSPSESSPVAVQVVKVQHDSDRASLSIKSEEWRQEIKVWGRLQSEHILPLLGLIHGYGPLPGLVSPWIGNGNLIQLLTRHHNILTRHERFRLLQDIASALQYLHSCAVVHGNLSGHNILVDSNGRAFVKGSGLSTMLDEIAESESYETRLGDVPWTAPELMINSSSGIPTSQSDVWSFGCNMIHVLSGQEPWQEAPDNTVKARLRDRQVPPFPEGISDKDLSFLRRCFSLRPADRPSADQILAVVHEEFPPRCIPEILQTVEATVSEHSSPCGIPDVMNEFRRRVFDQVPSHLIYIPKMKLVSREELLTILEPEKIAEEDISKHKGWSRKSAIESRLVPDMLKYAILSHRWGKSEPTFQDLKLERREGAGYEKLHEFCTKAKELYGCRLAWSDTCCINKESSSELDEAIRSMYRWYRDAYICIVHLAQSDSLETLGIDEWFFRGWTLQELLAPLRMKFYGPRWTSLTDNENDKDDAVVISALSRVTKIPLNDLCNFRPGPNRAWEKMTWAASRKTTRIEDVAYSLIGIFNISMTIAYGEGDRAFQRFMVELIQNCKEWQILVWAGGLSGCPTEPSCYRTTNDAALDMLKNRQISWWGEGCGDSDFSITKRGVQVRLLMLPASVDQNQGQSMFLSRPAGRRWVSPLKKLVVQSHSFPPASTTEWMIGIINYHDHDDADKGILKRGESYICFLLKRFRRPGMDTVRNHWRRQITEEILTVSCANDFEKILECVWL